MYLSGEKSYYDTTVSNLVNHIKQSNNCLWVYLIIFNFAAFLMSACYVNNKKDLSACNPAGIKPCLRAIKDAYQAIRVYKKNPKDSNVCSIYGRGNHATPAGVAQIRI